MTAHKALVFAAVTLSGSLLVGACSSNDASLGRNQGPSNANGGTGGSTSTSTGGSMSKGSSGSGNGSSGTTGSSGGSDAMGGYGGSTGPECENVQCFRSIDCVEECGGPVLKSSCCPCDPGTFDNIECGIPDGGVPTALNSPCVNDACPEGLTPVHYYGIAGPSGPLFCSCSIPCEDDPSVCPDGTTCLTISDGPGTVCSEI
jgi:hypothetical protein